MSALSFTCVIPAYNREDTLERAVRSALDQTVPPDEIIIVDDGSTDETAVLAESFEAPVRVIHQANAGASAARNLGAQQATSAWIAFLDSDDRWTRGHIEAMRTAIYESNGLADFYFGNLERTVSEGARSQWSQAQFHIDEPWRLREDGRDWVIRPRIPMMLQGSVFHRERFLSKGGLWAPLKRRHDTHAFIKHGCGSPICAVNHVGCVMVDDASTRLTGEWHGRSIPFYEYSIMLWSDLIQSIPGVTKAQGQLLKHRLFTSYWRLMREGLVQGQLRTCARGFSGALNIDPRAFALRCLRSYPSEYAIVSADEIPEGRGQQAMPITRIR